MSRYCRLSRCRSWASSGRPHAVVRSPKRVFPAPTEASVAPRMPIWSKPCSVITVGVPEPTGAASAVVVVTGAAVEGTPSPATINV